MRRSLDRLACFTLALLCLPGAGPSLAAQLVGPFTKDEYPQAVIDRPLTLPAGMVEGEIGGRFVSQRFAAPILGVGGTDDWLADVAVRVGVTDRVQVEVGTSFSLDHQLRDTDTFGFGFREIETGSRFIAHALDFRPSQTSWQRMVPVRLSLLALDTETLDTAVALTLPFVADAERKFELFAGRDSSERVVSRNGNGRVLPFIQLAAPTRWRLCDYFWLRAGNDLFSVTTDAGVARLAFDFGIGVQPHRMFAVTLDSEIASITFDGSGNEASTTVADFGALDLEGVFSPLPWFDVIGGLVAPDVGDHLRNYETRVAVRIRF